MENIEPVGSYHVPLTLTLIFVFILMIYCVVCIDSPKSPSPSDKLSDATSNRHPTPRSQEQLSKNYYSVEEVCPDLVKIYHDIEAIRDEVKMIKNDKWADWPEKELYDMKETKTTMFKQSSKKFEWNIYPFKAFDVVVEDNCKKCPHLWNFLQQIPGLKVALLSRLGPGTKLNSHRGWGGHSNHVIRCHFGFKIPKGCYLSVKHKDSDDEEIKLHKEGEWVTFDDSRYHYAHNPTEEDRIVLIIDVQRPAHIKTGDSDVGDTKELLQIVDYFRQRNLTMNRITDNIVKLAESRDRPETESQNQSESNFK